MELKKDTLQTEHTKGNASVQVTFDESYNLPDYLPDFHSVILSRGDVRLDEGKTGPGNILVKGAVKFRVFYRTGQNDWKISCLEGEFPFQETLILESADEFDMPQVETVLEDLSIQMMNSRKLNIRALLELRVSAWEREDIEIPVEVQAEPLPEILREEETFLELIYRGKERCHLREEIRLPSNKTNIRQILWQQAQIFGSGTKVMEGKLLLQGEMQIFVIYLGEEDGGIQWFETKLPCQCEVQIPEADVDVIPYITTKVQNTALSVQEDADGELRIILAEADLLADLWLYRERMWEMVRDLYALDKKLLLKTRSAQVLRLHMKNESKYRMNDTIHLQSTDSEILQICAGFGEVQIDRQEMVENGIATEGTVRVQVLYLTSNDNAPIEAVEGILPFRYVVEIPGILPDCRFELQCDLEQLSFLMKSSRELEVQAVISLQALVTRPEQMEVIQEVQEEPLDLEELNQQPGMVGLILTEQDSLWEIAKKYHTTREVIRKTNHLENKPVPVGTKLLLLKQILPEKN